MVRYFDVELEDSLFKFYVEYANAVQETIQEVMHQVLADFAFGALELGFVGKESEEHDKDPQHDHQARIELEGRRPDESRDVKEGEEEDDESVG
ncbi:MAG: hypothetical protein KGO96_13150 [Elusimicrobia bacterium]|nr:hypothetical protein [Elusimicrobiota bacterium]MDE2426841.1 hypothetical protein [Elusimicrobiota bacterium]